MYIFSSLDHHDNNITDRSYKKFKLGNIFFPIFITWKTILFKVPKLHSVQYNQVLNVTFVIS